MTRKFVSWRRVSTTKQGKSGLGLEAQKSIIDYFVKAEKGTLIADFYETYTGKDLNGCRELRKAMKMAKDEDAVLIIAKTDRFRNTVEALQIYDEMGESNIMFCDLPNTDKFSLTLMFALAEREAKLVSIRTKAALAEKKKQGYRLGSPKGVDLTKQRDAYRKIQQEKARNNPLYKIMWTVYQDRLKKCGGKFCMQDYQEISNYFCDMGIKTPSGLEFTRERAKTCYHALKRIIMYMSV